MSIHQCPKCELRFEFRTELDDHCWHDHPEFRHEYPASAPPVEPAPPNHHAESHSDEPRPHRTVVGDLGGWLTPHHPPEQPHHHE